MLVHVALDAYAFVGTHMFDTNDQIVRMNGRAADLFADTFSDTIPVLVSMLLSNLVENAIVHSESPAPTVEMEASEPSNSDEEVAIEVRDTNDQIPKIEVESLRAGDETPLQHGQDVGLWIVHWCLTKLRGSLEFEYDGGNHLTVTVPGGLTRQERQRADAAE